MRIRVTDAGNRHPNQKFGWSNLRHQNIRILQRFSNLHQWSSHAGRLSNKRWKAGIQIDISTFLLS